MKTSCLILSYQVRGKESLLLTFQRADLDVDESTPYRFIYEAMREVIDPDSIPYTYFRLTGKQAEILPEHYKYYHIICSQRLFDDKYLYIAWYTDQDPSYKQITYPFAIPGCCLRTIIKNGYKSRPETITEMPTYIDVYETELISRYITPTYINPMRPSDDPKVEGSLLILSDLPSTPLYLEDD